MRQSVGGSRMRRLRSKDRVALEQTGLGEAREEERG